MTNTNVSVELEKLEKLLNKVGDLVITNSMMAQTIDNLPSGEAKKSLLEKINLLQRHIVELQDYATDIRMVKFESMYETYNNFLKEIIPQNKKIKFISPLRSPRIIDLFCSPPLADPLGGPAPFLDQQPVSFSNFFAKL